MTEPKREVWIVESETTGLPDVCHFKEPTGKAAKMLRGWRLVRYVPETPSDSSAAERLGRLERQLIELKAWLSTTAAGRDQLRKFGWLDPKGDG